jgi:hypothetical protein
MKQLFFSLVILLAASCSSTKIVSSWRDPDVTVNTAEINKFMVAALLKNQSVRRKVEDDMASYYPGKAVQSYKEFGEGEMKDSDDVYNQKLKSEGFDGVVIMRLLQVNKQTHYVPGSYPAYYMTWRGYYRIAWPAFYSPGYYTTDKTYNVEVNVYSSKRNKLIWSATTSTMNPNGNEELFAKVIKTIKDKMDKEGFLK